MNGAPKSRRTKVDTGAQVAPDKKHAIVAARQLVRRLREYPRHARVVAALERRGR